ncbi:MAG: cell division protein FtsQ/DivIB [Proteobacteria bacterium]|nr:cell division protein FtsQ/DivIB [Pseudomonadota bacterium]
MIFRPSSGFICALLLAVGLLAFATVSIDRSNVERMSIVGDFDERQLASIKASLSGVDISSSEVEQVKQTLSELDWVHHANVRKSWPHAIEVEVFSESVIAYWNDNGFINKEGSVLYTEILVGGDLPHLYGPAGSELDVMKQFQQLSRMLNNYGHEIKVLTVTDRGSWSLETEEGVEVLLGKEDLKARMQRFLTVSVRLAQGGDARFVERMDARYINGVAVHFEDNNEIKLAEFNKRVGERSYD